MAGIKTKKRVINRLYDVILSVDTVVVQLNKYGGASSVYWVVKIKFRKKLITGVIYDNKVITHYQSGSEIQKVRAKYKIINEILDKIEEKQFKLEL